MPMLSLSEAAAALGVSADTVVRRIRAGKLRGEKDDAGRWVVWLDDIPSAPARVVPRVDVESKIAPATEPDAAVQLEQQRVRLELAAALETVESLRADKERLETRIDRAEDERSELRRMLFLEQQTVASLRALLPAPAEDAAQVPPVAEQRPADPSAADDRLGLRAMAHDLERKHPWWWLRDWRRREKGKS
jgi:excisionase family DNA binding protein